MARRLANPRLNDVIDLAEGYSLVEIEAPESWAESVLKDLNLRGEFDINLVAIKRSVISADGVATVERISVPRPNDMIRRGDLLMLIGSHESIEALPRD